MTETTAYRTKMIEVGLPLEAINIGARQEQNPFIKGHPKNVHLYWANRPLAVCRAVLFSSLVDDPAADPAYMDKGEGAIQERRQELHDLLAELVLWKNSNDDRIINRARAEIASSLASFAAEKGEIDASEWPGVIERTAKPELVNNYLAEVASPILDPFAGRGSIPVEAQRLGLRAYASDLNPVAVLINKALIEIPPKFANQPPINPDAQEDNLGTKTWKGAQGIADDVRYYGQWLRDEAEKQIGHLYPKVKITPEMVKARPDLKDYCNQELIVSTWLWTKTVKSPNPAYNHAEVPLTSTFILSSKAGKEAYVVPSIDGDSYRFVVKTGTPPPDAGAGTKVGRGATFQCLFSGTAINDEYIKSESMEGRVSHRLLAIVALGKRGRVYLSPNTHHEKVANIEQPLNAPDVEMNRETQNLVSGRGYGYFKWCDLFTSRQLASLCEISRLIQLAYKKIKFHHPEDDEEYARSIAILLSCSLSHMTRYHSCFCPWNKTNQNVVQIFGRQAIPMIWDFAEANASTGTLDFLSTTEWVASAVENLGHSPIGVVRQQNATELISDANNCLVSTDPPYYDYVAYADLSDFFYVWHKFALSFLKLKTFETLTSPKSDEIISAPYRHDGSKKKAQLFFQSKLETAFSRCREQSGPEFPITIYYAFRESESNNDSGSSTGWTTFLEGLIRANLRITSCFPIQTEKTFALKAKVNALSSSIVLACRPRAVDAGITTRTDFVRELRSHLGKALTDLQQSSIAPVDLQQSAIGPGMAVFSKYAKVLENDGSEMSVRAALGLINQALEEVLSEQEGEFDADTRFATIWFEQFGFETGDYGTAETLAKAKAISVDGVVDSGILESSGGKVRLLKPEELDEDWKPEDDDRLTVWEVTHYLCRALETGGVDGAADLVRRVGGLADSARDLAYRLFSICDKKKWATEAQPYNALVASWPDIQSAAAAEPMAATTDSEGNLFEG